jgi:ATPase subunit of ABC transporter with duplicated ATPase domains
MKCYWCVVEREIEKQEEAITQYQGSLVCQDHARWLFNEMNDRLLERKAKEAAFEQTRERTVNIMEQVKEKM